MTANPPALIFDAHLDIAFNAVDWNRDLRMSVTEIRTHEITLGMTDPGRRTNTVSFPELKAGRIGMGVATLFARQEAAVNHPFGLTTPEACYAARGAGSNLIWIDPQHDLVAVVRWIDKSSMDGFIQLVLEAVKR